MVNLAQKVVNRYAKDKLIDRLELALKGLDLSDFSKKLGALVGLLEALGRDTRMNHPEISHEAHALSHELYNTIGHLDHETAVAVSNIKNLLDELVF